MSDAEAGIVAAEQHEPTEPVSEWTRDEELFRKFVGPNADKFARVFHAENQGKKFIWSINWMALIAGLPWLFYRKLYIWGCAFLFIPILLVVIFPTLAGASFSGFAGVLAGMGNRWYVQRARRKVEKFKALGLPDEELKERLADEGGTSTAGAGFGFIVILALTGLSILNVQDSRVEELALPACSDPGLQGTAKRVVEHNMRQRGADPTGLRYIKFAPVAEVDGPDRRVCSFVLKEGDEEFPLYLAATWEDKAAAQYRTKVASNIKAVVE